MGERAGERRDEAASVGAAALRRGGGSPRPGLEERSERPFRRLAAPFTLQEVAELAREVALEDLRMDIALAADGRGVAERAGHGGDRLRDVALAFCLGRATPLRVE